MKMDLCEVQIPPAKCEAALEAIKKMHEGGISSSWVDGPTVLKAKTLIEALSEWRYESDLDDDTGDMVISCFTGEKLGDDEQLWEALAPYVKSGAVIDCRGEDDARWRWAFEEGKLQNEDSVEFWGADAVFAKILIENVLPAFAQWFEKTHLSAAVSRTMKARTRARIETKRAKRTARKAKKKEGETWERI